MKKSSADKPLYVPQQDGDQNQFLWSFLEVTGSSVGPQNIGLQMEERFGSQQVGKHTILFIYFFFSHRYVCKKTELILNQNSYPPLKLHVSCPSSKLLVSGKIKVVSICLSTFIIKSLVAIFVGLNNRTQHPCQDRKEWLMARWHEQAHASIPFAVLPIRI